MIGLTATFLLRIFGLTSLSFLLALFWTPILTHFLYKNKIGKQIRKTDYAGKSAPIFSKLHKSKEGTPTMGGLLVWVTTAIITLIFNLSRTGTWLPLFALVSTGVVGAVDDLLGVFGIGPNRGGLRFRHKLIIYTAIAALGAWWFASKLDWLHRGFHIPFLPDFSGGLWYVPIFIIVLVGTAFAVNETDGLDGLAGGVLATSFAAYTIIALVQNQVAIAAFSATIIGALLAFLWFNIFPARFFMGDTGSMALGMTLAVIAFLTNQVIVLPIIGFIFVLEAASVLLQIISKKFFGKKIFLSSPLHHHLEALGWPETKVTMRFWVISAVLAVVGVFIALLGR